MRASASIQSWGPARWMMRRCPSSIRCRVARRAPSNWSTEMLCGTSRRSGSSSTYGTRSGRRAQQIEHARLRGHDGNRPHRLSIELFEGAAHRVVVAGGGDDGEGVAGFSGGILDLVQDRLHAVVGDPGRDQHPDDPRVAGDQRAGGLIRAVAELLDDLEHARTRLGPQPRGVVENPRHRLVRHARLACDIADVRCARHGGLARHGPPDLAVSAHGSEGLSVE